MLRFGDRTKPVLLLLHGFMGDLRDFASLISCLEEFCCLVVDLPGHGQTEVADDACYLMPNVAQGLIELLTALDIEGCFLLGYSMGGRIALYLTIYFPQYFRGTILESASPGLKTKQEREQRIKQDSKLAKSLEADDFTEFVRRWYSNPLFDSFVRHPHSGQAIERRLQNQPLKLAKSLRFMGLGKQPSLWDYLPAIEIPVMLISGALDRKFVTINRQIANLSLQADIQIIDRSGHNVHFEQPIKLFEVIEQFTATLHRSFDCSKLIANSWKHGEN